MVLSWISHWLHVRKLTIAAEVLNPQSKSIMRHDSIQSHGTYCKLDQALRAINWIKLDLSPIFLDQQNPKRQSKLSHCQRSLRFFLAGKIKFILISVFFVVLKTFIFCRY